MENMYMAFTFINKPLHRKATTADSASDYIQSYVEQTSKKVYRKSKKYRGKEKAELIWSCQSAC